VLALDRNFYRDFRSSGGSDIAPPTNAEQGMHISGKLGNKHREIEANRDHIVCRRVRELR